MSTQIKVSISHVEEVDNTLAVLFNPEWQMDHLQPYIDHLLMKINHIQIKETIIGADLHCVRFDFEGCALLLNFEEYSHSCWLECPVAEEADMLLKIKPLLLLNK